MMNDNTDAIVKVECGDSIGTAFFISNTLLLTAQHNIENNLRDGDAIHIYDSSNVGKVVECKFSHYSKQYGDFCILESNELHSEYFFNCLKMPIKRGDKYYFFGYPSTILGQTAGVSVDVEIYKSTGINIIEGFDSTALVCGAFMPTTFTGFSGSPIFNKDNIAIGIVTHKLDGCVGFISIDAISETLEQNGIPVMKDYDDYDQSPYSRANSRKLLQKMINCVGPRYMRDLHVNKASFDMYFDSVFNGEALHNDRTQLKYEAVNISEMLKSTSLDMLSNNGYKDAIITFLSDVQYDNMRYYCGILEDINENLIRLKDEAIRTISAFQMSEIQLFQDFFKKYNQVVDSAHFYKLYKSPYICMTGKAGCGKTHLLCHIAEKYIDRTNVYMAFGSQFNTEHNIESQLQRILEMENKDYLQDINTKGSLNNRAFIIIDALNEGVGYMYWREHLSEFVNRIQGFPNISLVISIRDTFYERFRVPECFERIKHNGHDNAKVAKDLYFKHYKINSAHVPINTPEFTNSLFLKIFCETYNYLNNYERVNMNKMWLMMLGFIKSKELIISGKIDYDHHLRPVLNCVNNIAKQCITANTVVAGISRVDAHKISNSICPNRKWSESLLYWLLEENVLLSNLDNRKDDTVCFAYERMGDVFKALNFVKLPNKNKLKKIKQLTHKQSEQDYNLLVAICSITPDFNEGKEFYEVYPDLFIDNTILKQVYMSSLNYRSIETGKVGDIIKKHIFKLIDDKLFFEPFFNNIHIKHTKLDAKLLHTILIDMTLSEICIRWTYTINSMYEDGKLTQYYTDEYISSIFDLDDDESTENYLIVLSWLLSSSYPVVRDRVTRIITHILKKNTKYATLLLAKFVNVKDLYVLERLICAIYGVVLKSNDYEFIRCVSDSIYNHIFANNTPPLHIHLRQYARLIIEKAFCLNLISEDKYNRSQPLYDTINDLNQITEEQLDISMKGPLGNEKMLYSVGVIGSDIGIDSDFFRYILGGNSSSESIFSRVNISASVKTISDQEMFTVSEIAEIIANEIYTFGWSDTLGNLDENLYSHNRYSNKKERIGKKYQWLALYSVLAKLVDNYYIRDRWGKNIIPYMNPSSIEFQDYFDPSINYDNSTNDISLSAQATKSVDAPTQLSHPSNLESVHCDRDKMADPSPLAVQP